MSSQPSPRQLWIHALGAKVGGGLTYLNAIVPALIEQLEGKNVRVVLLLPYPWQGPTLPDWFEVRALPLASSGRLRRLFFDNFTLPRMMRQQPGAVLFCSGSFSPLWKTVRTVSLLRNALYFDDSIKRRASLGMRMSLFLQGMLIARGARGCAAVFYPSQSMRELVEDRAPALKSIGVVSYYGIGSAFRSAQLPVRNPPGQGRPWVFLYVMTYTLQKNLTYLLEALALAKKANLSVRVVITSDLKSGPRLTAGRDKELLDQHDLIGSGYLVCAGTRHGQALLDLYDEADAALFPSICESFGHPLVEAMALGKPLVCADLAYAREICGKHATYVEPNRPESLVEVWREWPKAASEIPPIDRDQLFKRFSWSGHVKQLLQSLLG